MNVFWHRPTDVELKARWHAYGPDGESLCGDRALLGIGRPKDSTEKLPKKNRCGRCLRKFNGR